MTAYLVMGFGSLHRMFIVNCRVVVANPIYIFSVDKLLI
jgi:hypothetical protein